MYNDFTVYLFPETGCSETLLFFFFFVFVNMGPYGSTNFKTLLLPQITFECFQLLLNFLFSGDHKGTVLEILSLRFFTMFFQNLKITFCHMQKPKISNNWPVFHKEF